MSQTEVFTWSLGRVLLLASLAVWISTPLLRHFRKQLVRGGGRWMLLLTMLPLLVPELVVGFTYRLTAQHLTDSPLGTELLHGVVLLFRAAAVALLVRLLLPAGPVSPEAEQAWNLLQQQVSSFHRGRVQLLLGGRWRGPLIAWCLTALVVFQDFETAALIQVDQHPVTWTVWLFDAHAGNQMLSHSLKMTVLPLVVQLLLLLIPMWLLHRFAGVTGESVATETTSRHTGRQRWLTLLWSLIAAGVMAVRPSMILLADLWQGLQLLGRNLSEVVGQQAVSLAFAATSAAMALSAAVLLRRHAGLLLTAILLLPGLSGSLILSLVLLWLFQQPILVAVWDSWLPLLTGQTLLLLPRAFLLILVLEAVNPMLSLHSARLLSAGTRSQLAAGQRILWRLQQLRWLASAALLCHWALWDVTTASILRPVTVEPVVTRLYREMHFSRTESLTALSLVTAVLPVLGLLLLLALSALRFSRQRDSR